MSVPLRQYEELGMLTNGDVALRSNDREQPVLPDYWTSDLGAARSSLLALLRTHGVDDVKIVEKALRYAEQCHSGQVRRGTDAPYAVHPIRLACLLIESFGVCDAGLLCTALLHDVLEDTLLTKEEVEREFGKPCADLVSVLSRCEHEQRPSTGDAFDSSYLTRIREYGDDAILLKMADKIDNLRDAVHHDDRTRVRLFVDETFSAYVPLARKHTDRERSRRAERLLLEAAARAGGTDNPRFLAALLDRLTLSIEEGDGADEIPFKRAAVDLYRFLNPEASHWLEFDEIALLSQKLDSRELARKIASSLRLKITGDDLPALLDLAGIPRAFASPSNADLWRRAAAQLATIQRLLSAADPPPWMAVLLESDNRAALLALVQSCLYLPVAWRFPLWAGNLGAVLSERVAVLSQSASSTLLPFVLSHRLALARYANESGTLIRARSVFEHPVRRDFGDEVLWALRIGAESLQEPGEYLDALWDAAHHKAFEAASLPLRLGSDAFIETIGLKEAQTVFAKVGMETQLADLQRVLVGQPAEDVSLRWIDIDHQEWLKRRPGWSRPGEMRMDAGAAFDDLEELGARVVRTRFGDTELMTVLPARRFALRDRLPEMTASELRYIEEHDFTGVSMFDCLILDSKHAHLWTPRVYRILDTIEDLDPEGVQTLTVDYDAEEPIPSLRTFLPLPDSDADSRQEERKRMLARYIVAQVYSCGLVRRVRRARISVSAVTDSRRPWAFTEEELQRCLAEAEKEAGLRKAFGSYIERYGFDPFGLTPAEPQLEGFEFGTDELRRGCYVGIDIGGQFIKSGVSRDGELLERRHQMPTPGGIDVGEFCRRVVEFVSRELDDVSVEWSDVSGIGISWPGAVRNNRIAGMSGVLYALTENGKPFLADDPIGRLCEFDFLSRFRAALPAKPGWDPVLSIVNDGDAEAFGNHALRVMRGIGKPGGKIVVKLGTSLAGGRLTPDGALAEDIAEFSKIMLNLRPRHYMDPPGWMTRHYVSSEGVRNLSRTFVFGGKPMFGVRDGANDDKRKTRIEAVELGMLLPLLPDPSYLAALVESDNAPSTEVIRSIVAATAAALRTTHRDAVADYIRDRGTDWTTGLRRTLWLCTSKTMRRPLWVRFRTIFRLTPSDEGAIPDDFPFEAMARIVAGSAALFSQLGLHIAHLVAQLYNIYRRGTFSEVVLAGGVLSGRTGEIVEQQAKAFLEKYYDKIYGPGKPLGPDTLVRSGIEGISNPGIFGAAMTANRRRLVERDRLLSRRIEERIRRLSPGEEVDIARLTDVSDDSVLAQRALSLLDRHFAAGVLARTASGRVRKIS